MNAPKHKLTFITPSEPRARVSVVGVCIFATSITMTVVLIYFLFGGSSA